MALARSTAPSAHNFINQHPGPWPKNMTYKKSALGKVATRQNYGKINDCGGVLVVDRERERTLMRRAIHVLVVLARFGD